MYNKSSLSSESINLRQKQLEECMFQNLLQKPYSSISVQDLCQQVGISRRAYYNYFKDKDECVGSMIDHIFRQCYLHVVSVAAQQGTQKEICTALMEYRKSCRPYLEVIVRNDLYPYLIRSMFRFAKEEPTIMQMLSTPEHPANEYDLASFIGSQLGLHLQWFFSGYHISAEEMADNFLRIAYHPALHAKEQP